jgi:hypothetical protein
LKTEFAKKIKKISIFVRSVNFPPHLKGGGEGCRWERGGGEVPRAKWTKNVKLAKRGFLAMVEATPKGPGGGAGKWLYI